MATVEPRGLGHSVKRLEDGRFLRGRGNYVVIYSPSDNHSFVYMHMLKPAPVMLGDQVHAGDPVGQLGCTGSCEGPHLHFEVRVNGTPVDPMGYL